MKTIVIPSVLHEVFGKQQRVLEMLVVLLVATAAPAIFVAAGALRPATPLWRVAIALVLVFDIAAGAVANLTRGTNDHYKERYRSRIVFIAAHWHLVALFAVLSYPIGASLLITAYTLATAFLVNACYGTAIQRVLGGALAITGTFAIAFLQLSPPLFALSCVFLFKVSYSFAVDHHPGVGR